MPDWKFKLNVIVQISCEIATFCAFWRKITSNHTYICMIYRVRFWYMIYHVTFVYCVEGLFIKFILEQFYSLAHAQWGRQNVSGIECKGQFWNKNVHTSSKIPIWNLCLKITYTVKNCYMINHVPKAHAIIHTNLSVIWCNFPSKCTQSCDFTWDLNDYVWF